MRSFVCRDSCRKMKRDTDSFSMRRRYAYWSTPMVGGTGDCRTSDWCICWSRQTSLSLLSRVSSRLIKQQRKRRRRKRRRFRRRKIHKVAFSFSKNLFAISISVFKSRERFSAEEMHVHVREIATGRFLPPEETPAAEELEVRE